MEKTEKQKAIKKIEKKKKENLHDALDAALADTNI